MPVIEKAIETAALMLGSDRSRGYCLEMICADFLAGANLDHGDPETLLFSMTRFFRFLPENSGRHFLKALARRHHERDSPNTRTRASGSDVRTRVCASRCCAATAGGVNLCGTMSNLEVHHKQFRSHSGHDTEGNLITLCWVCHTYAHNRSR